MSHYYGCLQRLNPYGPCTCEAIQQADHTSAMNRLADEMAITRVVTSSAGTDDLSIQLQQAQQNADAWARSANAADERLRVALARLEWCANHEVTFGVERGAAGHPDEWIVYQSPHWDRPFGTGHTYQDAIDSAMRRNPGPLPS